MRARRLRSTSMRSSSLQSLSNNITFNASIKHSKSITNNHKPLCLSLWPCDPWPDARGWPSPPPRCNCCCCRCCLCGWRWWWCICCWWWSCCCLPPSSSSGWPAAAPTAAPGIPPAASIWVSRGSTAGAGPTASSRGRIWVAVPAEKRGRAKEWHMERLEIKPFERKNRNEHRPATKSQH